MKNITPEIYIENCKENLEYYQKAFGGEIKQVQKSDNVPGFEGIEGKIIHSELHIDENCVLYFVDVLRDTDEASKISLVLSLETKEDVDRIFEFFKDGGEFTFEPQKTFWGSYHGVITDKNGISWGLDAPLSK